MKRLLIIRHAKSSWDNAELTDFERPLNKRGERDLPDMAIRLKNKGFQIQGYLSSPAKRAITTAIAHAQAFGIKAESIVQDHRLYHASSRSILQVLSEMKDNIEFLAVFGHNPGLTHLIQDLSDFDLWNLPTCAVCGIELDIDSWKQITETKGKKFYYDYPKSRES
jgi:phosphohistidine phosphatase